MLKPGFKHSRPLRQRMAVAAIALAMVPALSACKDLGDNPYYPPKPPATSAPSAPSAEPQKQAQEEWRKASLERVTKLSEELKATADKSSFPHHIYQLGPIVTEPVEGTVEAFDPAFELPSGKLSGMELQARYLGEGAILVRIGDSPSVTLVEAKPDEAVQLVSVKLAEEMSGKLVTIHEQTGSAGAWAVTVVCNDGANPQCTAK
ncbi:hypothetical protein [Boudabousia marimammalium]|uniref:Uncharacterized protein n=1 Tax=Boudabousia marimammalium TaxID=156892 RepID=A0A1Q5PS12_9ACTO|nr:hypothetical protein [Boudabousia marimammalium]OKL50323.1 hypothetical protein BM477_02775 [Boudabousia marimammalium]